MNHCVLDQMRSRNYINESQFWILPEMQMFIVCALEVGGREHNLIMTFRKFGVARSNLKIHQNCTVFNNNKKQ